MANYDFHSLLEPMEFQELACQMLQLREGVLFERYKDGPDQGIDGAYVSADGRCIMQAKRYKSTFSSLKSMLKNSELPKVKKLNPSRYILAVSMDFSPAQKQELTDLFEGYIQQTGDIVSAKDMNGLLVLPQYHQVLMAFPNLWYASYKVMEKAFKSAGQAAFYKEAEFERNRALHTAESYLSTRVYKRVVSNWKNFRVILLTGVPGIGKTSTAQVLAAAYLLPDNMDGYIWANSIEDVYAHWDDAEKAVFILDDFWGSIFHEKRGYKEEARLEQLIRRVVAAPEDKHLILTTREYILQQGIQRYPKFRDCIERIVYVCSLNGYDADERAGILYRHLYASKLDYNTVQYLYEHSDEIVYHRNYDPRLLAEFLKEIQEVSMHPRDMLLELQEYFDDPMSFWQEVFTELSDESKAVALLLQISLSQMALTEMEQCYNKYIALGEFDGVPKTIGECIAELEKTMLVTNLDENGDGILLRFRMPAIQVD